MFVIETFRRLVAACAIGLLAGLVADRAGGSWANGSFPLGFLSGVAYFFHTIRLQDRNGSDSSAGKKE